MYNAAESRYLNLINKLVHHSKTVSVVGFLLVGLAIFGLSRIPTGFIPLEDQGYLMMNVQLPDGASLNRTEALLKQLSNQVQKIDGIEDVITINGISLLDNSANLANEGVLYVMFKDWSVRGKNESLLALYNKLNDIAKKYISRKSISDGATADTRFRHSRWISNAS